DTIKLTEQVLAKVPPPPNVVFRTPAGKVRQPAAHLDTGMVEGPLTSAASRLKGTGPHKPLLPLPKPETGSGNPLVGKPIAVGESELASTILAAPPNRDKAPPHDPYFPAAWSPDGSAVFVVGGDNVLRRFSTADQPTETARLRLEANCTDLAVSKA